MNIIISYFLKQLIFDLAIWYSFVESPSVMYCDLYRVVTRMHNFTRCDWYRVVSCYVHVSRDSDRDTLYKKI